MSVRRCRNDVYLCLCVLSWSWLQCDKFLSSGSELPMLKTVQLRLRHSDSGRGLFTVYSAEVESGLYVKLDSVLISSY